MRYNNNKNQTQPVLQFRLIFDRSVRNRRLSIRRERLEGEFETILEELQPSKPVFETTYAMFNRLWDMQGVVAKERIKELQAECARIDKQIAGLIERIVDASSHSVISAYEQRIGKLEQDKVILNETIVPAGKPQNAF